MATTVPPVATECLAADQAGIARAAALLKAGRLVAFPTETVYGLGGDATRGETVAAIYAAKGRPQFNPLIAHVADFAAARRLGQFNAVACKLADAFWPGPLTLVVPRTPDCPVSPLASAGLDSIAIRIPAHPVALELLRTVGLPLAGPSANPSGGVSPTTAAHVLGDLDGVIAAVIDGGATVVGVESTVVACLDEVPRLLRLGGASTRAIRDVLGTTVRLSFDTAPEESGGDPENARRSPGQLASHYAPHARLRMNATEIAPGEAALLFGAARPPGLERAAFVLNLSESGDLIEAAANLFSHLRRLDAVRPAGIAVTAVPQNELGEAINDRLRRAAAPR